MAFDGEQWELESKEWKVNGGMKLNLRGCDDEKVVDLLNFYVPFWDSQLHTVPHVTRIRRKDLVSDQDVIYDSEVAGVYQCLCEVSNLTGMAFHSYSRKHAEKTFKNIKQKFEIDWILINRSGVFIIEVGNAEDWKKSQLIINKKVEQITTRSKSVVRNIFDAVDKNELFAEAVNLVVALPNTPLSEVTKWMKGDGNKEYADQNSLIFLTSETLISSNVFKGGDLLEQPLKSLFEDCLTEQQSNLKFISMLFVVGSLGLLKAGKLNTGALNAGLLKGDSTSYQRAKRLYIEKNEKYKPNKNLNNFLEHLYFPDNIILTMEQYKYLDKILSEDEICFQIVGEAGSGKSTILLLLLLYYAGKNQTDEKKQHCIFYVSPRKSAFLDFVSNFANKYCDKNFVSLYSKVSKGVSRELFFKSSGFVLLADELYEIHREFYLLVECASGLLRKCVTTFVCSGQITCGVILPDEFFFPLQFRKSTNLLSNSLRNSSHISKVAAKIRRFLQLRRNDCIELFDFACPYTWFAPTDQLGIPVEVFDQNFNLENLEQDIIFSYEDSYPPYQLPSTNTEFFFRVKQNDENVCEWDFTGIEANSVAVVIHLKNAPIDEREEHFLEFLYSAVTRARTDITLFCSSSILSYLRGHIELDPTDKTLNSLLMGKTGISGLKQFWPKDSRQVAFLIIACRNGDIELAKQVLSLILEDPAVLFDIVGIESSIPELGNSATIRAIIVAFALLNPFKPEKFHEFMRHFLPDLPTDALFYLRQTSYFAHVFTDMNWWNSDNSLLNTYKQLVPLNEEEKTNNPKLITRWFTDEDNIANCPADNWNLENLRDFAISSFLRKINKVPTILERLKYLLEGDDDFLVFSNQRDQLLQLISFLLRCISAFDASLLSELIEVVPKCFYEGKTGVSIYCDALRYCSEEMCLKLVEASFDAFFSIYSDSDENPLIKSAMCFHKYRLINQIFDAYYERCLRNKSMVVDFVYAFAASGDIRRLRKILATNPDILYARELHLCLFHACECGQTHIVEQLLTSDKAGIFTSDSELFGRFIGVACLYERTNLVKLLVPYSNVNEDSLKHTMCLIAQNGSTELAEYMLQNDKTLIEPDYTHFLVHALVFKKFDFIKDMEKIMERKEIKLSRDAHRLISLARVDGQKMNQEKFSKLPYVCLNRSLPYVLSSCTKFKNVDNIGLFITFCRIYHEIITDSTRKELLSVACELGYLWFVRYLSLYYPHLFLVNTTNAETKRASILPLLVARYNGYTGIVEFLMKHHPAMLVQACYPIIDFLILHETIFKK